MQAALQDLEALVPPGGAGVPRILIAEDNLVNQKVILKVMQKVLPDSRPTVVNNGLEAVEVASFAQLPIVLSVCKEKLSPLCCCLALSALA